MPNPLVNDLTRIVDADFALPRDRPLVELTADLLHALGDPDPVLRDELALPVLATWVERGVYDDRLTTLGDGLAAGLRSGLGEDGTPSVVQRSFCALVLAECVARDTDVGCVPREVVLAWSSALQAWFLAERDLRGWVPDLGWAHALAHGADALGVLAASPHLGAPEILGVLDVLLERIRRPTERVLVDGEPDRLAAAVLALLDRDLVGLDDLAPRVVRLGAAASVGTEESAPGTSPFLASSTAQAFLRALHLQLALGARHPGVRDDLLPLLVDALRASNPHHLPATARGLA